MNLWRGRQLENDTLLSTCDSQEVERKAGIEQIGLNTIVVESTHPYDVTIHCGANHGSNEVTTQQGAIVIQLAAGCTGQTSFGRFAATEIVPRQLMRVQPADEHNESTPIFDWEAWTSYETTLSQEEKEKGVRLSKIIKELPSVSFQ